MTVESEILGGGLPLTDPTTLAGAQRKLFDVVMGTMVPWANAGFQSTTGDGRLIGSFNPFLLNPAVASHPRWRPPQGLPPVARKAGISEDAIRTLARGGLSGDLRSTRRLQHVSRCNCQPSTVSMMASTARPNKSSAGRVCLISPPSSAFITRCARR